MLTTLIVLFGLGIFFFFIFNSGINANTRASFADMITGEAHRPFVTRVFLPWLTRGITALFPASVHEAAKTLATSSDFMGSLLGEYNTPPDFALEALISLGLQLLCVQGFAFAFRGLFRKVYKTPALISELVTLMALIGLTPMLFLGYLYDLPTLFLSTLGLYCIAAQRKRSYFLVLALAVLNKETAIVLAAPAILLFWDLQRPTFKKVLFGILAQLGIFLAVRVPLSLLYRDNPGRNFEPHLADHIEMFQDFPIIGVISILIAVGMILLVFHKWRQKPAVAVLGATPGLLMLVLFVLGGIAFEIRVFYEVYAAGLLCIMATLMARKMPLETSLPTMQEWLDSMSAFFGRQVKQTGNL
ncbi:MAG: hypothetical protein A2X24_05360 [Chloroflexi bacterium GWB2_54_36]|nr:MAG: hypothetical protein A2X24_05360 [Chloroflexi bacterium GWB2_54_36]HBA90918.1 hypothetical protein [Anaerolineaceae bacterium]